MNEERATLIKFFRYLYLYFKPINHIDVPLAICESHSVYDPSLDEMRILRGEVESYFD